MEEFDIAAGVARITAMAKQAFRDPARASRWLRKPKKRSDGKSPLEMLATEGGARLVEEMILQFEYGMTA